MIRYAVVLGLIFAPVFARAQTADQLVSFYLVQNHIAASPGDYQTCNGPGLSDGVCSWNIGDLGAQPSAGALTALIPAWQAQQAQIGAITAAKAQYAAAISAGLAITSTGAPGLSATYGTAPADQANLSAIIAGIGAGQGLPGGGSTFAYLDIGGAPHLFTATQITALYNAGRNYVYELYLFLAGQQSLPPAMATIP